MGKGLLKIREERAKRSEKFESHETKTKTRQRKGERAEGKSSTLPFFSLFLILFSFYFLRG